MKPKLILILFGATGDLARRKLLPAFGALYAEGRIAPESRMIAFGRRPWSDEEYRAFAASALGSASDAVRERVRYVAGSFDDADSFARLAEQARASGAGTRLVCFFAVSPEFHAPIAEQLADAGLGDATLMIEKPFGTDLMSAQALLASLRGRFPEERILPMDHYLAKPAVHALVARRFEDAAFDARLSKNAVAGIAVRILESLEVGDRGAFYDRAGAFRDVVQNHALILLATILAKRPDDPARLPSARAEALAALATDARLLAAGQYEGYRNAPGVSPDSHTETYVRVSARSRDPRWEGVPLVIEAGKALPEKVSAIEIEYRDGARDVIDVTQAEQGGGAYGRALEAAALGDRSLFPSFVEIERAWEWAAPVMEQLASTVPAPYARGSIPA